MLVTVDLTPREIRELIEDEAYSDCIDKLKIAASAINSGVVECHMIATANKLYWRGQFIGNAAMYRRGLTGRFWQVNLKTERYLKSIRRKTLPALIDAATEYMKGKENDRDKCL